MFLLIQVMKVVILCLFLIVYFKIVKVYVETWEAEILNRGIGSEERMEKERNSSLHGKGKSSKRQYLS